MRLFGHRIVLVLSSFQLNRNHDAPMCVPEPDWRCLTTLSEICRVVINRQNTAKETIASHHGLNTIGNATKKAPKSIERHVSILPRAFINGIVPHRALPVMVAGID